MIEHRKRQRLAHLNKLSQVPVLPKKPLTKRKRKPGIMLTPSNVKSALQSASMASLPPKSIAYDIDSNGNSDPLPRRKRSPAPAPTPPPPLPPPRSAIAHSKSLTIVSLDNRKICTEV
jgi:hypothetical protein